MASSPYTVPTGAGYLGVTGVSKSALKLGVGQYPGPWPVGTTVYATEDENGVRLTRTEPESVLEAREIIRYGRPEITLGAAVIDALNAANGEDIREYERGADVVLVRSLSDPFVGGDDD